VLFFGGKRKEVQHKSLPDSNGEGTQRGTRAQRDATETGSKFQGETVIAVQTSNKRKKMGETSFESGNGLKQGTPVWNIKRKSTKRRLTPTKSKIESTKGPVVKTAKRRGKITTSPKLFLLGKRKGEELHRGRADMQNSHGRSSERGETYRAS